MATRREPEVREWDDEWLVRRGNYLTLITPDLARTLLERNTNNRRPKPRAIALYARDMKAGKWDPDAADLKFARTGELIDGQNRLMAAIEADVPFPTLVRTGLSLDTKKHVDTGVKRTAADALKMMRGVTHRPQTVAAAAMLRLRYERRLQDHNGRRGGEGHINPAMSHEELFAYLDAHPHFETFASDSESIRIRVMPGIAPTPILAWLAWGAEIDKELAHQMVDRLLHGELGGPGDPLQALLRYAALAQAQRQRGSGGNRARTTAEGHLLTLIQVWNATRKGESMFHRITRKSTDILVAPE